MIGMALVLALLALDLFTKHFISMNMALYESIPLIENLVHITYVHNRGAAFSLLEGRLLLFQIFTGLAVVGLLTFAFMMRRDKLTYYIILTTLAGALGNLYDRLVFGYVRDFIDVRFFAVFNIADIFIVVGMIALVVRLVFLEKMERTNTVSKK